jgi:hypothetical protein
MAKTPDPVILELASLPREQVGPFLLLGLPKDAGKAQIEKNWSDRVKWSRRGQLKVALEDVNWARDVISDVDRRIQADVASLNTDTLDSHLSQMARRYEGESGVGLMWQPLDSEKDLADYVPATEVPKSKAVRDTLTIPELPQELPVARTLLEQMVDGPVDPWGLA